MSTIPIVRNADVLFLTTFADTAEIPILPTSVIVRIAFHVQGSPTIAELDMSDQGNGVWKAIWPNDNADAGTVEWCILADGGNHAADQGFFSLQANRANPQTLPQ